MNGNMMAMTSLLETSSTSTLVSLEAKLYRGFGDPSRLSLLKALRGRERCVSELVESTGLSQPNASAHLACLRDCGLVVARKHWRSVYYCLADERLEELFLLMDDLMARISGTLDECARYRA